MFVYYANFIDLYYLKKIIDRNYIIISGAARGRREYNKGHDRINFSKMGKNESADP